MMIATSFILLGLGSAGFLSIVTLNYLNYYPALGKIQLQTDIVSIVQGSNQSQIDARVTIVNPTDYAGFRIENVIVDLTFHVSDSNATLFGGGVHPEQEELVGQQLGAHSTVSTNVIVHLNPMNASSFAQFVSSYRGRIVATVELTLQVITFLVTVYGREYYMATQDLPLPPN